MKLENLTEGITKRTQRIRDVVNGWVLYDVNNKRFYVSSGYESMRTSPNLRSAKMWRTKHAVEIQLKRLPTFEEFQIDRINFWQGELDVVNDAIAGDRQALDIAGAHFYRARAKEFQAKLKRNKKHFEHLIKKASTSPSWEIRKVSLTYQI